MKHYLLKGIWALLVLCVAVPAVAQSADELMGEYIENTYTEMGYYSTTDPVTINFPQEDSITITNIQGYKSTIGGRVDWNARTITFLPQKFTTAVVTTMLEDGTEVQESYDLIFSSDSVPTPVVGTISPNGIITLDEWKCVALFSDESGEYWDYPTNLNMLWTQFILPNAVMKTTDVDGANHEYRVHVAYTDNETASIINFAGKATISVKVRHGGHLSIKAEQPFYYYNNYFGYASLFFASYNLSGEYTGINLFRSIMGTGTAQEWTFDPWSVCFNNASQYPRREWLTKSSTITLTDGSEFVYPEAKDYGWQGEGTEKSPYLLSSAADFELVADYVQTGEYFEGIHFRVTKDIDFTGSTFRGIATGMNAGEILINAYHFDGTLDGDGHKLSNLHIEGISYDPVTGRPLSSSESVNPSLNYVALVGELRGSIKNLTIDETCSFSGDSYVAAFAAMTKTTLDVHIYNCRNFATVKSLSTHAGGIVGCTGKDHKVEQCYNGGTIIGGTSRVGGIAGYFFRSSMIGCQNDGYVTSVDTLLNATGQRQVGGLIGYCCGSQIKNSLNTGTIKAPESVGGLIGEVYNAMFVTNVETSYNVGAVLSGDESKAANIVGCLANATPTMSQVFYDAQMRPYGDVAGNTYSGVSPLTTAELISGSVAALDASVWQQELGSYPLLKCFADINHDWAKNYLTFNSGENAYGFTMIKIEHGTAALAMGASSPFSLTWSGSEGTLTAPAMPSVTLRDTLLMTSGSASTVVPLRRLPVYALAGEGTESDPYLITSVEDYLAFAEYVNVNNDTYEGKFLKVTRPLDFSGYKYVIPYSGATRFEGTLDGNNQTLSHIDLILENSNVDASQNKGLFGTVGAKGTLKNLVVDESRVIGYAKIAGLVGVLYGTLDHCSTGASVTVQSYTRDCAGLVGTMLDNAVIRNCVNRATVFGSEYCAGMVIYAEPNTVQILSSENHGKVYNHVAEARIYGGSNLAGFAIRFGGLLQDCANYGVIDSWDDYAAGFTGWSGEGARYVNCVNYGNVTTRSSNVISGYAAGICSMTSAAGNVVFDRCGNYGKIYSGFNYAAGICAHANAQFVDCWNMGQVQADNVNVGGITALASYATTSFHRCWNTGKLIISDGDTTMHTGFYGGGIVGQTVDFPVLVSECWNAGHIINNRVFDEEDPEYSYEYAATGGIVGEGAARIEDCFNVGTIETQKDAAGIIGYPAIDYSAHRCWSAGKVYNNFDISAAGNIGGFRFVNGADISNLYFDIDAAAYVYDLDQRFNGGLKRSVITSPEMAASMGDKFDCSAEATYPQLRSFLLDNTSDTLLTLGKKTAAVACATYLLGENDLYPIDCIDGMVPVYPDFDEKITSVTAPIRLGLTDVVTWTATGGLTIIGDYAYPTGLGEATLTVSMEGTPYTRKYSFEVAKTTAIESLTVSDPDQNAPIYDLYGRKVSVGDALRGTLYLQGGKKVMKR